MFSFFFFLSCSGTKNDTGTVLQTLIDLYSWKIGTNVGDPYPEHQPEDLDCPATAFRVENEQLEIEMDLCNYAHVFFESNQKVNTGTTIEILILHTGLWAEQAALAHAVISHQDTQGNQHILFEAEPSIPSQAEFFFHEIELETSVSKGDKLHLHLHNHGSNDWKLGYIQRKE